MPSWFDGECESQWKSTEKKKFFTVIVVKIYSPSIYVYKDETKLKILSKI